MYFVPVGNFARGDALGITIDDVVLRQPVRARPANYFAVPKKTDEHLKKQLAWRLADARAPERYRGEVEPLDKLPGHIPGAANHFFQTNVDESGVFLTPEDLRARHAASLAGVAPDHVVAYCGSGVTACHNLLAMEHAGFSGAKLYPGSWSEWSADSSRPVERS